MKKTIFVIDDDQVILDGIHSILDEEGYKVISVTEGKALKEQLKLNKPDLILLDYLLEGDNGVNIAKELKINKDTKNVPVILVSGSSTTKELAAKAGAIDFIEKPFGIQTLIDKIHKHLKP